MFLSVWIVIYSWDFPRFVKWHSDSDNFIDLKKGNLFAVYQVHTNNLKEIKTHRKDKIAICRWQHIMFIGQYDEQQ